MTQGNYPSQQLQHSQLPADKEENNEVIPRPVDDESDDNEETEDPLDLIVYNNNNDIASNAHFNITSSQNVVIGNVTHVHGVLTINQNPNGNEISINSEEEAAKTKDEQFLSERNLPTSLKAKKHLLTILKENKTYWIVAAILIVTTLFLKLYGVLWVLFPSETTPSSNYGSQIGKYKLLYYNDWGGLPHKSFIKSLEHPVPLVIIKHTAGRDCNSIESCSKIVNWLQNDEMLKNEPDIIYNFLIGGTGDIFVGRGWDYQNQQRDNAIDIAFIGNFGLITLNENMIDSAQDLIKEGVKLGKIDKNYKLLPHNQTAATASPGLNVFSVIKTWPHYFNQSLKLLVKVELNFFIIKHNTIF